MPAPDQPPAIVPIVAAGDPVLRAKASPVALEKLGSPELLQLVEVMFATMRDAPGVGLAAPQIGLPLRLIVLEEEAATVAALDPQDREARGRVAFAPLAIVNPVLRLIEPPGAPRPTFFEGCLSVPGYSALVSRVHEVEVEGLSPAGAPLRWRTTGWPARILQHECDHLDGTLYVDRMHTRSFCAGPNQGRWAGKPLEEIAAALGIAI